MATRAKHKERSKRRHIQKEAAKKYFFKACNWFTLAKQQ